MVRSSVNRESLRVFRNRGKDARPDFRRLRRRVPLHDHLQPRFFERLTGGVFGFGDAIAVEHQRLAGTERRLDRPEGGSFEHAQRHAGAAEPFVHASRGGG